MKELDKESPPIKVSGYLLPWDKTANQPCRIEIENTEFIAVFSSMDKLEEHLLWCAYGFEVSVKQIDDTDEFLDSVIPFCRVALDPHATEKMTTRWTELKLPQDEQK